MLSKFIKALFVFIPLLCCVLGTQAQTLYWVGGSGHFNDPAHWSLSSGGASSNLSPNASTDVVFDDLNGANQCIITLVGTNTIKSLKTSNTFSQIYFVGAKESFLNIKGDFNLNQQSFFTANTNFIFEGVTSPQSQVTFGLKQIDANITFKSGNFKINSLMLSDAKTLALESGVFDLEYANITVGHFKVLDKAKLTCKLTTINSHISTSISNGAQLQAQRSFLIGKTTHPSLFSIPPSFNANNGLKLINASVLSVCQFSLNTVPSCSGTCSGVLTLTLDPTCTNGPYEVISTNGACPFPDNISATNIPSVYTSTGNCNCPSATYNINVLDGIGNPVPFGGPIGGNQVNFTPPSFLFILTSYTVPTCPGQCDGRFRATISGGVPPYTVTANPPTIPAFTVGSSATFTINNICANTYSFTILDNNGCSGVVTRTFTQPPALLTNSVLTNINCNGLCNGSFSISPTGGNTLNPISYTVNFSTGASSLLPVGGAASANSLCIGAISATVTDVKGCTVTAGGTVTQPPAITLTPSSQNLLCNGVCSGSAAIVASGGTTIAPFPSGYTYTWAPGPGNTSSLTNLCAGQYTITVADNVNCRSNQTFTITQPPAITLTPTFTNITCNGLCNGIINSQISGGTGGLSLAVIGPAPSTTTVSTSTNATGLCPGTYSVVVRDGNACSTTSLITLTQPPPLTVTATRTNVTCFGVCNGVASATAIGGTGPIPSGNYTWTAPATVGQSISGLCQGSFTLNVLDLNGCPINTVVTITQPTSITITPTVGNLSCNSICNGSINAGASGGTPGYTFSLITPAPATLNTTPPYTNLCAGTYTIRVVDVNACVQTRTVTIVQPNPLVPSIASTSLSCFGICNGTASGTVTGGTPTYTYSWTTPTGTIAGSNLTGLCQGTYTLNVLDANTCTATSVVTINQPTQITATLNPINPSCPGLANGSISFTLAGGTAPYTFTWSSGSGNPNTGLGAGSYTLSVTDFNNCTRQFTTSLTTPPPITLTPNTTSITCNGLCNGSATITATGGVPGYTFQFNTTPAPTTNTTGLLSSLCTGNYSVTVTDNNNCTQGISFNITTPQAITITATPNNLSCNGVCNGSITASASGGTPSYTFQLLTPTPATINTAPPYTGLCAGTYTLRVTDSQGCVQTRTVTITQPNPLIASVNSTSVTCFGLCNGSASGSAIGGTPSYTFTWSTPSGTVTGTNLTNLCVGSYTLNVLDASACTASSVITIVQPTQITATLNTTNPTCPGLNNGSIGFILGGGTPTYTFNWSSGTGNPNTGLGAGTYTLFVTDGNGCTRNFTTSLIAPPPMTVATTASSVLCNGLCNGSASSTVSGGVPGYVYQFNTTPLPTTNTTGIVSGLCAGNYILNVTDNNGCVQTANFSIAAPPPLIGNVTGNVSSCNACTGAATVVASGGTPTYNLVWSSSVTAIGTGTAQSNLCPGTYTVNILDGNGCFANTTVTIVQTVSVTVSANGSSVSCFGGCNAQAVASPSGGVGPYSYTWTPTAPTQTAQTATALCAGVYTVTAADQLGCSNTATIAFVNPPAITLTANSSNVTCFNACNGSVSANASGGTGPLTFSWSPGGFATPTVGGLCPGVYTVQVTDANLCSQTRTVQITQPSSITAVLTSTTPSACIANNGIVCVTPSGGSGSGYTFTWTPAGSGGANNACNTGLGAGNYTVVIADGAGCTQTLNTSLSNPTGPTLTINSSSIACFGGAGGSATVIANGISPFTFTISPPSFSIVTTNTVLLNSLTSGTYNAQATDGNGCITSQSFAIVQPTSLTVNSSQTNVSCNAACNGSIGLSLSGGTTPFTFTWSPTTPTISGQGTASVSALCASAYTVTISDANLCVTTRSFTITQPSSISVTFTKRDVTCNGVCDGTATAIPSGGVGPYTFTWTPIAPSFTSGLNSGALTNLCANVYTVTVGDANNCTTTATVQISQPTQLSSTITTVAASCNGTCNGTAILTATGGVTTYTFSWSNGAPNSATASALCAGNYTGTITDANGCQSSQPFTILQPAPINVTLTPSHPKCNAACNGSISTTVSGGTPTYIFSWVPSGSGQNPTNLCPNSYTLTVTDASLCSTQAAITLTNPPAVIANISFTNPSCNGVCNGSAAVTPSNVTAPVNFTWSAGTPTNGSAVSGLCNGTVTVLISDANNCTATQSVVIVQPSSLTINPSSVPSTCGASNGSISVGVVGGTPTYSYTWVPSTLGTNSVATGLPAGIYTLTVNDSQSCTSTAVIPLGNSNGPSSAVISTTNVTCFGQCNGSASVTTIVGGTPGYTVAWLPPVTGSINPALNLCAGSYTAQITDANNCILFSGATITQPQAINDNEIITNPKCFGVCDGSITLAPTGGTGPAYTYSWSTGATTSSITNACVGTPSVTITDLANCTFTASFNLTGTLNVVASAATTSNTCFGNCLGSATLTSISGGLPPYTVVWNNSQVGNIANNLCNGNYTATITDGNSCINNFTTSISSPAQITATTAIVQPSCGVCNGASTITAQGGVGPAYTYSWSTGTAGPSTSSLCAGIYNVTIVDGNNCVQNNTVIINNSNGITGENITTQNEQCFNQCNGSATVAAIGGNPPINYTWINPVATGSIITNLCGGSYLVQMSDAQGCLRTATVGISSAVNISVTTTFTTPSCGLSNGTLTATASGGSGVFTYTWLPSNVNSATLNSIGAGSYTVLVSDGACTRTTAVTLNNSNAPVLSFTSSPAQCFGTCTGSAVVTATGGVAPYTFAWSSGSSTNTATGLCNGLVTVTVTGNNGCLTVSSFSIGSATPLSLGAPNIVPVRCNNDCNGVVTLNPFGGSPAYTFSYSPSGPTTNPGTNLCSGTYSILITDARGCTRTTTVNLDNPLPIAITTTIINSSCSSINDGAITASVSGGSPAYSYTYTGPTTGTVQNLINAAAGNYTLAYSDSRGCRGTQTLSIVPTITIDVNAGSDVRFCQSGIVDLNGSATTNTAVTYQWFLLPNSGTPISSNPTVSVLPPVGTSSYVLVAISSNSLCFDRDTVLVQALPPPPIDAGPSQTISILATAILGGNPTAPTAVSLSWTPAATLSGSNIPNPLASNTINTVYTLTIVDADGCIASDTVRINIIPEIKIPNGISPNGDGKNDTWIIDNIQQFPDCLVEVYNRWGELLFTSTGYTKPWDGKYNGKDLPVGTYYYVINLNSPLAPKPYTGPITIFR
jgi:gliding motility-associated-like protein